MDTKLTIYVDFSIPNNCKSQRIMSTRLRALSYGLATLVIPGLRKKIGTGGTDSARYCYSVWLRHMRKCRDQGIRTFPSVVAELGPGDSLGIGLAALISGADQFYALDVVRHANNENNLKIFDELLALFQRRAAIPDGNEFPRVHPTLSSYDFPSDILSYEHLSRALAKDRIERIRLSVKNTEAPDSLARYIVPWDDSSILKKESVDMIISQAVLEHIDKLQEAYQSMRAWLKPSGFMSHEIDFKCHGMADEWNGHWAYYDMEWLMMRGRRPWFLNRQPHSVHMDMLKRAGFRVVGNDSHELDSGISRKSLARSLRHMTDTDLVTSSAFIVSVPDAPHPTDLSFN